MKRSILIIGIFTAILAYGCGQGQEQKEAQTEGAVGADSIDAGLTLPSNLERTGPGGPLRYRFTVGDRFGIQITTVESVRLTRDSIVQKNDQTLTYRYVFEVLESRADGSAKLQATCTRVIYHIDYGDVKGRKQMSYDTDENNSRDKEKVFAQYVAAYKVPLTVMIDAQGRITSVGNVEAAVTRLLGDDAKTTRQETKAQLAKDLSENSLKNTIQLGFLKLDEKEVPVDSSWTINWDGAIGFMRLKNHATYTLRGYTSSDQGRLAHVVISMVSQYVGGKTVDTGEGMATIQAFDVSGSGTSAFNVDQGRCADRHIRQRIFARFFIEAPAELKQMAPDQAKDFTMTQDAQIENRITVFTP